MTRQCLLCCTLSCPSLLSQSILLHFLGTLRNLQRQILLKTELYRWEKTNLQRFCTPQHIRHVIFSKYQASPNTPGNFIAGVPASLSLWSVIVEFGAEMLQIIVPPRSLTRYPQTCWQRHAWLYWHRVRTISCEIPLFWRVILHLDEFAERGHSVAHKPLRQCGSGDRKHGTVTAAPCATELPLITQHQPLCAEPLLCTPQALDTEIPSQVFPRLSGHLGA